MESFELTRVYYCCMQTLLGASKMSNHFVGSLKYTASIALRLNLLTWLVCLFQDEMPTKV